MTVTSPDGDSSAKQLATQHGLVSASKIPGLGDYIKSKDGDLKVVSFKRVALG